MHKSSTGYVKKAEAHMKSQQKKLIGNNQDAAKTSLELAHLKNRVKEQDQKIKKMDALYFDVCILQWHNSCRDSI
jgi:hypothetical protein